MSIKKLHSTYTTPEQARRLLDLGLPADTADCYYDTYGHIQKLPDNLTFDYLHSKGIAGIPCWSAGQLIQIHTIIGGASSSYYIHTFPTNVMNEVMWHLVQAIEYKWVNLLNLEE